MKLTETQLRKIIREVLSESDLDIGHDDEAAMVKNQVQQIAHYGNQLYDMLDQLDQIDMEVDFPHWWQEKVITAHKELVSATQFLETELRDKK